MTGRAAGIVAFALVALLGMAGAVGGGDDDRGRVIADFEGDDYGAWTTTGEAFGTAPARGTLPGQMAVEGYLGRGLANSFLGGDDATGTLASPPFVVERPFLNFLVGGGRFPGETCVELIIGGKVVRTATGPNDQPGGTERLEPASWDVSELAGRVATIRIADRRGGGWGHINIDHIVQADRPTGALPARREVLVARRYLHLPIAPGGPRRRMRLEADGTTIREFEIEMADDQPDDWVFADISPFLGRNLTIAVDALPLGSKGLDLIAQDDEVPGAGSLYREPLRPQFHVTARRGWLNDPNGLTYLDGEYHLFFQHNPFGTEWGNMHWGHAVSRDLVHWEELPIAIHPRQFGDWAFSGSGVVDERDTTGFGGDSPGPLVVVFTSTGRGECLAYSRDRGRTFHEFDGNPVLRHQGRDPKVFWHEPTKRWIMTVYDEADGRRSIALHGSPDLKSWQFLSRIDDFYECPDLFELPVSGEPGRSLWVLHAADGRYLLGTFDGHEFRPESGKHQLWFGNFYAAQTFSHVPDGRRIQIGWGRGITFPGMPFNQQMTVPVSLTLRPTTDGVRLFAEPVEEHASLRVGRDEHPSFLLADGDRRAIDLPGDLVEVRAEFEPGPSGSVGLVVRGVPIVYDADRETLSCRDVVAPLAPVEGHVRLSIWVDRGSVEVIGNDGRVALSVAAIPSAGDRSLTISARGGPVRVGSVVVHELGSSWMP